MPWKIKILFIAGRPEKGATMMTTCSWDKTAGVREMLNGFA